VTSEKSGRPTSKTNAHEHYGGPNIKGEINAVADLSSTSRATACEPALL
jgi:hypothetical protein